VSPRLALDLGKVRTGIALAEGSAVVPLATLPGTEDETALHEALRAVLAVRPVAEVVCGLPLDLRGQEGPAAQAVRRIAERLAAAVAPLPVRLVDERLTTRVAERGLRAAGRGGRQLRRDIDQWAAVGLLRDLVDRVERTGDPGGEVLRPAPSGGPAYAGEP